MYVLHCVCICHLKAETLDIVVVRTRWDSTVHRRSAQHPTRSDQMHIWLPWIVCRPTGLRMMKWLDSIAVLKSSHAPSYHQSPLRYLLDRPNCHSMQSKKPSVAFTVSTQTKQLLLSYSAKGAHEDTGVLIYPQSVRVPISTGFFKKWHY